MARYIDVDALLKQIEIDSDGEPGYYGDTWKFIDTIKNMPVVTINGLTEEIKVTKCNHNHIAEADKMEPFARGRENDKDTVYRKDVIDQVVTAVRKIILDPAPVDFKMSTDYTYLNIYNVINSLPSAQPDLSEYSDKLWRNAYERGKAEAQPEPKEIGYGECANAMLKMWIDNVLTDGEYNRIMDKLNKHWVKEGEEHES